MMSRTLRRGQHDEVSRAEVGVAGFAGLELFVASDAASFVTGHIPAVDGGYVAQ